MGKNIHLINIYLKIHNKKTLTMDELGYLAEYDPECFAKTCKNVVYNIPETRSIMEPSASDPFEEEQKPQTYDRKTIERILENLRDLEMKEFPVADVDADKVKSLLGNLYMELLYPHNDKDTFLSVADHGSISSFDKKA